MAGVMKIRDNHRCRRGRRWVYGILVDLRCHARYLHEKAAWLRHQSTGTFATSAHSRAGRMSTSGHPRGGRMVLVCVYCGELKQHDDALSIGTERNLRFQDLCASGLDRVGCWTYRTPERNERGAVDVSSLRCLSQHWLDQWRDWVQVGVRTPGVRRQIADLSSS
jgi:hypothetical protein